MKPSIVSAMMFWTCLGGPISLADSGTVARVEESGEALEQTHEVEGRTVIERLPLYRAGVVQYFSAGIGLEERKAEYLPFSLKVVFTAGGNPYLCRVVVTI